MLGDPGNPNSLSTKFRRRRDVVLRDLVSAVASGAASVTICDIGGTIGYWRRVGVDFLRAQKARITLVNVSASELGSTDEDGDLFEFRVGDGCNLSEFSDGQFDLVHSNSVIEHVGDWARMKSFAAEVRRVGRFYYVQTPYYWFPFDPHFYRFPMFHWMPRHTKRAILQTLPIAMSGVIKDFDMAQAIIDRNNLLDRAQMRFLFPDGKLTTERVAGMPKSMISIRSHAAGGGA